VAGKLYLIPVTLGGSNYNDLIPEGVLSVTRKLRHFIAEDERSARRYLRLIDRTFPIDDSVFHILNEHTREDETAQIMKDVIEGCDAGILSEAGMPGIADPGSAAVRFAHRNGIRVVPLSGPSSILLALVASGLNGQSFRFRGYFPVKQPDKLRFLKEIENEAKGGTTQIFMETPYRSYDLSEFIIKNCSPEILLCIASELSLPGESVNTRKISEWRRIELSSEKRLTVFLLGY
jgi:16S rRNA (cytidine1402-2'-O)-methyltransferase